MLSELTRDEIAEYVFDFGNAADELHDVLVV